ncbi:MAG: hypothetical protein ABR956_17825 [Terracidiphilus sp.]|jgi:hypothetical protein
MDEDQDYVLSPVDPRITIAEKNVVILEEWLSHIEQLAPASNESWLLISLLKSARRAYHHLRNGWQCDSTYTAWACRNLLELRVFAKYIAASPENRKRFVCDLIVDSEEKSEALKNLAFRVTPELSLNYDDPHPGIHRAMRDDLSFQGGKYLSATQLAPQLGLEADFRFTHKMCSKLVHPTAQSILSIDLEDQNERDVHLLYGCNYLTEVVNDIIPVAQALVGRPTVSTPQM